MDFFGKTEIRDMVISVVVLTFAFGGTDGFLISLIPIAILFLAHEFSHKFAAEKFSASAEFKIWPFANIIAIATSLLGFLFLGSGGIFVSKKENRKKSSAGIEAKEIGIIALAGPAANILIGIILIAIKSLSPTFLLYTAKVSFLLAVVNLVPVGPLDGVKVARWSWIIWGIATALAVAGYVLIR